MFCFCLCCWAVNLHLVHFPIQKTGRPFPCHCQSITLCTVEKEWSLHFQWNLWVFPWNWLKTAHTFSSFILYIFEKKINVAENAWYEVFWVIICCAVIQRPSKPAASYLFWWHVTLHGFRLYHFYLSCIFCFNVACGCTHMLCLLALLKTVMGHFPHQPNRQIEKTKTDKNWKSEIKKLHTELELRRE